MRSWMRGSLLVVAGLALVAGLGALAYVGVAFTGGRGAPLTPTVAGAVAVLLGGVLFWLLVGAGALRATRGGAPPPAAPRPVPRPPAIPDDAALADLREPITACPDCGFLGIRFAGLAEGAWPGGGELAKMTCPRCGYIGLPLEFERREDYRRFLEDLAEPG